jgi:TorA maturation chaperone TorD
MARLALRGLVDRDARAAEHRAAFGHVVAHGCPPYETEYGRRHLFGQAQELADIAGFYGAAGLRPGAASERPDHVACELEFLAVAVLREAEALARGADEPAARARELIAAFLRDHAGRWLPAFAAQVERRAPGTGYAALATLTARLVADHALELGVEPEMLGPEDLRPVDGPPEAFRFACGPEGLEPEPPATPAGTQGAP